MYLIVVFDTFYFSKLINLAVLAAAMVYSCYNGASFYIDVFSYKYRLQSKARK